MDTVTRNDLWDTEEEKKIRKLRKVELFVVVCHFT